MEGPGFLRACMADCPCLWRFKILKNDSSAGPQTGVGLPNGVVPNRGGPTERAPKEEIRSSENPKFRVFDKITENRFF